MTECSTPTMVRIDLTLHIDLLALTRLRYHATVGQGIELEQLFAQYIGRCAQVFEQRYSEGLFADVFDAMIKDNASPVPGAACGQRCPGRSHEASYAGTGSIKRSKGG